MSTLKEIYCTNTTLENFYYSKGKTDDDRRRELEQTTEMQLLVNRLNRLERWNRIMDIIAFLTYM
ncbi:4672_t:CDS:1, partial [Gigaspora rosea]